MIDPCKTLKRDFLAGTIYTVYLCSVFTISRVSIHSPCSGETN